MSISPDDVKTELTRRQFPCLLSDDNYTGIIEAALRELSAFSPVSSFGHFPTVDSTQDYFIFDDSKPEGVVPSALAIRDVIWNPGDSFASLDIFSPGFQLLANASLFSGNWFDRTSEMVMFRQKLDNWKKQFGQQGYRLYGQVGDPDAFLRLYPVPRENNIAVLIEYTQNATLSSIMSLSRGQGRYFMQWVEAYTARALANHYASTASIEIPGVFREGSQTNKYWDELATKLEDKAIAIQGGTGGEALRT